VVWRECKRGLVPHWATIPYRKVNVVWRECKRGLVPPCYSMEIRTNI
jgi:hypothetical protein